MLEEIKESKKDTEQNKKPKKKKPPIENQCIL